MADLPVNTSGPCAESLGYPGGMIAKGAVMANQLDCKPTGMLEGVLAGAQHATVQLLLSHLIGGEVPLRLDFVLKPQ